VDILAAVFVENFNLRPVPGPSTRIDLSGVFFSLPAPSPFPLTLEPHLIVIIRCGNDEPGQGVLEVIFERAGEQIARNVQPFTVEPGKFTYRLVRGELDFEELGTIEAKVHLVPDERWISVPLTLLAPVEHAPDAHGQGHAAPAASNQPPSQPSNQPSGEG